MKVREMIDLFEGYAERHTGSYNVLDAEIVVVTKDPSVGPVASVKIDSIQLGFDWNKGKVLIYTEPEVKQAKPEASRGERPSK